MGASRVEYITSNEQDSEPLGPGGAILLGGIGGIVGGFMGKEVSTLPGRIIYQR